MTARERRKALVRLDMAISWAQLAAESVAGTGRAAVEAQGAIQCLKLAREAVRRVRAEDATSAVTAAGRVGP